jgi:hypothetical protein
MTSCLSPNVGDLSYDDIDTISTEDGTPCMFPSYMDDEEVANILRKYDINISGTLDSIICQAPIGTTCTNPLCQPSQKFTYNPMWNGTCVPVSCSIGDEIKEVYNISYENCPSGIMDCGLSNITCKNESYEVSNTRKSLYCRSPHKVGSDYLTNNYSLIDIGCSSNPPPRSSAEQIRRERMASTGSIISGDASDQASQRQGPNEDNIGEMADFSGSTENQQLELERGLQDQLDIVGEQVEGRSASLASMGTPTP